MDDNEVALVLPEAGGLELLEQDGRAGSSRARCWRPELAVNSSLAHSS